ncbi:unnamed protein product [Sphenostylis stenocarpa]|uniref:Protein SMG7 n=1 Tax=Sphenostylis stenocarpa TaxID=92480 RepID=A0AA86SLM0_9FABA|nr:unnamed protein product [Sphenostylis stenocarpa]
MMLIEMDKMSAPSSLERAQRLYEKNLELENKRRRSAQARVPSDPNAWQQMRENYEAIILEDHAFSEQHNIEYALWQLHYKRIEEFRAYFSGASLSSTSANSSQGVKGGPARPDRITKIRLQFKTFLSEATGFYHDLITKIRAKYGLPLGYFEDSENRIVMEKDGKKSAEMKKGLVACHRCLIYLGDLARYKGMYGEGDSKNREYTAASSYYLQAASLWPSSGNPHHQLALLASYSGDMLVTIYRYFRSLAVDSPFITARENLIVAFEKNRLSFSQLSGDAKAHAVKESSGRVMGKGRGKGEAKLARGTTVDASPRTGASSIQETYIYFCTCFVRLNGILFTRTSLETFAEVLAAVSTGLRELLTSGQDEELNFGTDAPENALVIVRIVCILVFTVYNVNKESEGQTYAEIVQRAVLLQNAFAAAFELMGYIIERCAQLLDPSSSYLLPGILVFVEWLACYPDLAAGNDVDETQANLRSEFWNRCVSFLNKLLSVGPLSIDDDEEETCFNNMSRYEEGETENRHALWEDFELRGFVPLLPAQTILDFSRKHSIGSDGDKERNARVKRILAAGKALANVVKVDKKMIYFDSKVKKFVIGIEPQTADDFFIPTYSEMRSVKELVQENSAEKSEMEIVQQMEGDDDDEVIVFKPIVSETRADVVASSWAPHLGLEPVVKASGGDLKFQVNSTPNPLMNLGHQTLSVPGSAMVSQQMQPVQPHTSRWLEEGISLANNLKGLGLFENGHVMKPGLQEAIGFSSHVSHPIPIQQSIGADTNGMFYGISKALESVIPSKVDAIASSGVVTDNLAVKAAALPVGSRKAPVSRPTRHLGPPPGFSHVPPKQGIESTVSDSISGNPMMDDYSWLDGYHFRSSTKGLGSNGPLNYSQSNSQLVSNNGFGPNASFPFPGKQVHSLPLHAEKQNGWQDYQNYDMLKSHHDQQLQPQQLTAGNQQFSPLPEQFQGQSIWTGRYFV